MDIRSLQRPLKDSSRITLTAHGIQADAPIACSVDLGRAIYKAQEHKGVGGAGTGACSGDLLLGALAACAQITCQMVAAAMGIPTERIDVTVEGDLDLQGILGISKEAPVGFESIRHFQRPRAAGNGGAIKRVTGEDGAILRGDANVGASATD